MKNQVGEYARTARVSWACVFMWGIQVTHDRLALASVDVCQCLPLSLAITAGAQQSCQGKYCASVQEVRLGGKSR